MVTIFYEKKSWFADETFFTYVWEDWDFLILKKDSEKRYATFFFNKFGVENLFATNLLIYFAYVSDDYKKNISVLWNFFEKTRRRNSKTKKKIKLGVLPS